MRKLLTMLKDIPMHCHGADSEVLQAVTEFIQLIKNNEIVLASANASGSVWGRKSLLVEFSRIFDPLLEKLFPSKSYARNFLSKNEISFPLANSLRSKHECRVIADKLKIAVQNLEESIDGGENDIEIIRAGENLEAVATVLYAIHSVLPNLTIHWCTACFRRAPAGSDYCDLHRPSQDAIQDTNYRKALRINQEIFKSVSGPWERNRTKRCALGDDFTPIFDGSLPIEIRPHSNSIVLDAEIGKLVSDTMNAPWLDVASRWDEVVNQCPNVKLKFPQRADSFESWEQYCNSLQSALQNNYEGTKNAYWIIFVIKEAEDWLSAEHRLNDRRRTSTQSEIVSLYKQGIANQAEIARRVGKSRQYVAKILKLEKP